MTTPFSSFSRDMLALGNVSATSRRGDRYGYNRLCVSADFHNQSWSVTYCHRLYGYLKLNIMLN